MIMGEYFKPPRRKLGIVTLGLACVLMAGWGRSLVTINKFTIQADAYNFNRLVSIQGCVAWQRVVPKSDSVELTPELFQDAAQFFADQLLAATWINKEGGIDWKHRLMGFEIADNRRMGHSWTGQLWAVQVVFWKLSYWWFIAPLTLLSAWLLLSKPRPAKATPIQPPV
jgi:hypothetical protein